jgi:hypothetical protein
MGVVLAGSAISQTRQTANTLKLDESKTGEKATIYEMKQLSGMSVINIDKRDGETIRFLHNIGFAPIIEQYEMILEEKY